MSTNKEVRLTHDWLTRMGVPKVGKDGKRFSLRQRVLQLYFRYEQKQKSGRKSLIRLTAQKQSRTDEFEVTLEFTEAPEIILEYDEWMSLLEKLLLVYETG